MINHQDIDKKCEDILAQLAALTNAVAQIAAVILDEDYTDDEEDIEEEEEEPEW